MERSTEDRRQALACIPLKNGAVHELQRDTAGLLLAYPAPALPRLARLLRRLGVRPPLAPQPRRLQLDTLGAAVWDLLDGERSVAEVSSRFAGRFQLHPREAEVSVSLFLRELGRRGMIALGQPAPPGSRTSANAASRSGTMARKASNPAISKTSRT